MVEPLDSHAAPGRPVGEVLQTSTDANAARGRHARRACRPRRWAKQIGQVGACPGHCSRGLARRGGGSGARSPSRLPRALGASPPPWPRRLGASVASAPPWPRPAHCARLPRPASRGPRAPFLPRRARPSLYWFNRALSFCSGSTERWVAAEPPTLARSHERRCHPRRRSPRSRSGRA